MGVNLTTAVRRLETLISADPSGPIAYALRMRLGRTVRELQIALEPRSNPTEVDARIVSLVDRLAVDSRTIMQPSSPFDGVWQVRWSAVRETATTLLGLLRIEGSVRDPANGAHTAGGVAATGS